MTPFFSSPGVQLFGGDSLIVLPAMPENSVDSVVCDPPYELTSAKRTKPAPFVEGSPFSRHRVGANGDNKPTGGFMGKEWDGTGIAFKVELWAAVLRVLKPGAHLLAFGGTRTHHRMVCAIEDAGFEIRDEIDWIYGQGFPKSLNFEGDWEGWGTALKPAKEPICLARKPVVGTILNNLTVHGVGAINIDGCRVEVDAAADASQLRTMMRSKLDRSDGYGMNTIAGGESQVVGANGRWPANLIHDGSPEVIEWFPDAGGQLATSRSDGEPKAGTIFGAMKNPTNPTNPRADSSRSAGRFFYTPKATKSDREEGCSDLPERVADTQHKIHRSEMDDPRRSGTVARKNFHPTVKPTALMRYLCRLITPPGGTVIDPFMGSGSTGKAARLEGFNFIGIEKDVEAYGEIAKARISAAQPPAMEVSFDD